MSAERALELLALGKELRRRAEEFTHDVNESHLLVHEVLADAFREDPRRRPSATLRDSLTRDLMKRAAAMDHHAP